MIKFAGHVVVKEQAPYIYLIRKGPYLYIGETQRSPILRWAEHLHENGSFRRALLNRDAETLSNDAETAFFAFKCCRIETDTKPVEKRRVTQFVEHLLHIRIVCSGKCPLEIISDTTKTAPTDCKYEWVNELVDQIYLEFLRLNSSVNANSENSETVYEG